MHFMDTGQALVVLALGYAIGRLRAQALLAEEKPAEQPPAPPQDPRRDPGWCHSHGKHRNEEEAS